MILFNDRINKIKVLEQKLKSVKRIPECDVGELQFSK